MGDPRDFGNSVEAGLVTRHSGLPALPHPLSVLLYLHLSLALLSSKIILGGVVRQEGASGCAKELVISEQDDACAWAKSRAAYSHR